MTEILGTILAWSGLVLGAVGLLSVIRPLRFLRVRTRRRGAAMALVGLILVVGGISLPVSSSRVSVRESQLDAWAPEWQFREAHSRRMQAAPAQVYKAIREVTANEILLFQTLTWIRNPHLPGRGGIESVLNAPGSKPILDVALTGGFRLLADDPPREVVIGTLVLWDGVTQARDEAGLRALLTRPGNVFAAMNFRVHNNGDGSCTVTTETRVFGTDPGARRQFARYWRVIYPGSALLRYTWLRAIAHRASGPT
ncbi:MAG: hypothetical protein ABIP90_12470 [Vicinamibacterales bacterium]